MNARTGANRSASTTTDYNVAVTGAAKFHGAVAYNISGATAYLQILDGSTIVSVTPVPDATQGFVDFGASGYPVRNGGSLTAVMSSDDLTTVVPGVTDAYQITLTYS